MEESDPCLSVLLADYDRTSADIRTLENGNFQHIGLALTFISGAAVFGKDHVNEVFYFIPVALVAIVAYILNSYTGLYSLGGYRRYLSEAINQRVGLEVISWENIVVEREKPGSNTSFLVFVMFAALFILGLLIVSFVKISEQRYLNGIGVSIYGAVCLSGVVLLGISSAYVLKQSSRFYDRARQRNHRSKLDAEITVTL